jgi:NAD(P)H-hydrate epimerase
MKASPPLFDPLPTPEEMQRRDALATDLFGLSSALLMENAGREAFAVLQEHCGLRDATPVLILMGGGNNGGDGAVLARYLHDAGCAVLVRHTHPLRKLRGAARLHALAAKKNGVPFLPLRDATLLPPDRPPPAIIVDALLGTGLKSRLRDRELALIRAINARRGTAFLCSLDIPSGLNGLSGKPEPEAVHAHLTVTFAAGKPGLFLPEAAAHTGKVVIRPIGMPSALNALVPSSWRLLAPKPDPWFQPDPLQHKGKAGKVLIIGASPGMVGAPALAALGALRAGAGLVHVACPPGLEQDLRSAFPEILTHPLGYGRLWEDQAGRDAAVLAARLAPDALILGPGLGRTPQARHLVHAVLERENRCPAIVDADALRFFRLLDPARDDLTLPLDLLRPQDILTPHPGEMAALLAYADGAARVQDDRVGAVNAFIHASPAVLALKGAGTLIARAGAPLTLAPFAVACLGVGGSGDVLSGVCAALVASGLPSLEAACLGVHLHGRAGELLARESPRGHLARDIADAIPRAWAELCPG